MEKLALTPTQVATIYEAADEPAIKAAIGLAATTGMRRGEVLGLKWADIDSSGVVTISRAWTTGDRGQHMTDTKNRKLKVIPLGTFGTNVLTHYRRHQVEVWGDELGEWVLSYVNGELPLSARVVTAYFGRLTKRLGIKATFHDLRHFAQSTLRGARR